jgi:hypothetical protein
MEEYQYLEKKYDDLREQNRNLRDQIDKDYCRLQMGFFYECLIRTKKAQYDVIKFKSENCGAKVRKKYCTDNKFSKCFSVMCVCDIP